MDKHEKIYEIMLQRYGKLPHPIHEPKRSEFYLKMIQHHFQKKELEAKTKKINNNKDQKS